MNQFYFFELVFLGIIILDALSQGFSHSGVYQNRPWKRKLGNVSLLLLIGIFVLSLTLIPDRVSVWMLVNRDIWDVICLSGAFLLFRYSIFNIIYNSCYNIGYSLKRSIFYLGGSKKFDRAMTWFLRFSWFGRKFKPPVSMFMFWSGLFAFIFAEVLLVWRLTEIDLF